MNERIKIVDVARSYLGVIEGSTRHLEIVKTYNSHKPLARGYALKPSDSWCAGGASTFAIMAGVADKVPLEVSCNRMIDGFRSMGRWVENDGFIPQPGDFIFYDWDDSGSGDNHGSSDHVGVVESVSDHEITVIECNKHDRVERRLISVDGKYIRGYGVPEYQVDSNPDAAGNEYDLRRFVEDVQCYCRVVVDGVPGGQTLSNCPTLGEHKPRHAANWAVQRRLKALGYYKFRPDGCYGKKTAEAMKSYQSAHGLYADGICGPQTWRNMMGV